jgi:pyridoxine 5-phosphate synthase
LTSNAGWDTISQHDFLKDIIAEIKSYGVRTSIFIDPDAKRIEAAARTGTDRVELYTESYASHFLVDKDSAVAPYRTAGKVALDLGLGLNAGHDLNLANLSYFAREVPGLFEVSIGHALISDALYFGLQNTVQLYLRELQKAAQ